MPPRHTPSASLANPRGTRPAQQNTAARPHNSAVRLREAVLSTASDLLEAPADDLALDNGSVTLENGAGVSSRRVSFAEVARTRDRAGLPLLFEGAFDPVPLIRDSADGLSPYAAHTSATRVAEVDVDPDSGDVRVLRTTAAHDVGRAALPLGLRGQIEGGIAEAIGLRVRDLPATAEQLRGSK